jgi:serine protease Do
MKLIKILCAAVAIAGVLTVLMFVLAPAAHGQARRDFERPADWYRLVEPGQVLQGFGSQIGVTARDLEPAERERLDVPGGVLIEEVRPGSPAANAGLQANDVVVEFDGERVRGRRHFVRLVQETPPNRAVTVVAMRDGRRTEVSVTPGAEPWADQLWQRLEALTARIPFDLDVSGAGPRARLGITAQELTPELAGYFGAKDGVLVAAVADDSPARRAGLMAGDVITSLNGRTVASTADLVRELLASGPNLDVTLGIVRDKKASSLTARLDPPQERRASPGRRLRPIRFAAAI